MARYPSGNLGRIRRLTKAKGSGKDLAQFLQEEIGYMEAYAAAGNSAAADQEASDVFGARKWTVA